MLIGAWCWQMLADAEDFARQVNGLGAQKLAGSGQLCEKKDFILEKFDQLLTKLQGDDHMLNFTDAATEKAYDDAMQAWLDTESVYRLAVEVFLERALTEHLSAFVFCWCHGAVHA